MKRFDVPLHKIYINSTSINQGYKRTMKQKHKYFVHNSHSELWITTVNHNNPIVLHSTAIAVISAYVIRHLQQIENRSAGETQHKTGVLSDNGKTKLE